MNYATTFQYYDAKGRRLAVFCRYISPTEAEVFTLTCSKQDQFSKKYAHNVYLGYLSGLDPKFEANKPLIELVLIEPEQRELQTLIKYCHKNYYFYVEIEVPAQVLVNVQELNEV